MATTPWGVAIAAVSDIPGFPDAEDGFLKASPKCLSAMPGAAIISGKNKRGESIFGGNVRDLCFIAAVYDGDPDLASFVFYFDCELAAPEEACVDMAFIDALPPPGRTPIGVVTRGDVRIRP